MALRVFDVHHDVKNFLITPEIRMRFYRMEVGQVDGRHSHDLGHEIFFILEGRCEMEVEGERAVLEPGQACVALRDQMHQARNVGDTPVLMYLSVSPHVLPTHTYWSADPQAGGRKLPARYHLTYANLSDQKPASLLPDLIDRHLTAVRRLGDAAAAVASVHADLGPELRQFALAGDLAAARIRIDLLWAELLPLLR
ncbi:MAG TPA: cupin domain-containing protein, partial [Chloroflexota bacterium]|nr:cupin domain-containing protein [Chloroflexota bacterium]